MTDTPPSSPADDELVEMMRKAWRLNIKGDLDLAHMLACIRPHLEARGIEMAADYANKSKDKLVHEEQLRVLGRRHAEGKS